MPAEIMISAGAAAVDITPRTSQFLFGYPHVERYSTGVHDPLYASALYLHDGSTGVLFLANDIIFVDKKLTGEIREAIEAETGVPAANILVSATHTHSGPITVDHLSNEGDPLVPNADPAYRRQFVDGAVQAGVSAVRAASPAVVGLVTADGSPVGTNRRDPSGPSDPEVPVLYVRDPKSGAYRCVMLCCSMHPTVLHEDSSLISGDFPGMARRYLRRSLNDADLPVVYHTGPAGNQSPRHVTRGNTFDEAERLGGALGRNVEAALRRAEDRRDVTGSDTGGGTIRTLRRFVEFPVKTFPPVAEAEHAVREARARFQRLRSADAPRQEVRTAECDVFGAEETLTLATAARDGRVAAEASGSMPAEIQVIRVGGWTFVGWPGETFIEYSLRVKAAAADTYVISLANGETQGYIVTPEAAAEGGYEASNALFEPASGDILVEATLQAVSEINAG